MTSRGGVRPVHASRASSHPGLTFAAGTAVAIALAVVAMASDVGCVVGKRALKVPDGDGALILLCTTEMPEPITDIARHGWFAVRDAGATSFERIEYGFFGSGPFDGESGVMLHAIWRGERAERGIACLRAHQSEYRPNGKYLPWPGPNSNTFVDSLLRRCDLHADLPATAIGRDYRGLIGVSWTAGGTGVQFETPIAGVKLGLTEGIEVHFFALAFGLDLWPPALIVPFGPGRIGFADR